MSSGLLARFVALYYAHLAPDDAQERTPDDREGAARAPAARRGAQAR